MPNVPPNLLIEFFANLQFGSLVWQVALLAFSLFTAWMFNRYLEQHLPRSKSTSKFALDGLFRVLFPLSSLLLVLIGKSALQHWQQVNLLNISVALLLAAAVIRLAVYILRHVFSPSNWLHGSERLLALSIWVVFALHLTGLLPEVLDALDHFSFNVGKQRISLLLILTGVLAILVTMLLAMWLGRALEHRVMSSEQLDINLRVVLSKLIRAVLVVLGILIALPLAGIDITVLSVFGGALGVGIGFGLQKIASNYVSGFIILLDRSIHPGDVLTVDGRVGKVTRLTARYLVLQSNDGTDAIIPNDALITSTVISHSYSNCQVRISLPIQISYQSDLERAMAIMRQASHNQPRVLSEPEAKVYLKSFGENGIDLELCIWISDPEEGQLGLRSDLNLEIWRTFKQENIEIPYPHRDVRLLSGSMPG